MEFNHPNSSLSVNHEELFQIPNVHYENRHCNQDDFSILICGGENDYESEVSNDVYELKGQGRKLSSMLEGRYYCKTAIFILIFL